MKHILLSSSLILIFSVSAWAQNVGIGVSNPAAKLEVADTNVAVLRISSVDNSAAQLELFNTDAPQLTDWRIRAHTSGNLLFQASTGEFEGLNLSFTAAAFTHDRRFGFGTRTPEAMFEVRTADDLNDMRLTSTSLTGRPGYNLVRGVTPVNSRHWRMGLEGDDLVMQTGRNDWLLDSIEAVRILPSGEVGIGTIGPKEHLVVQGFGKQVIRAASIPGGGAQQSGFDMTIDDHTTGIDWRMINEGGYFRLRQGTDNFQSLGTEHLVATPLGYFGINMPLTNASLYVNSTEQINEEGSGNYFKVGSITRYIAMDEVAIQQYGGVGEGRLQIQNYGGDISMAAQFPSKVIIGGLVPSSKLHVLEGDDVSLGTNGYFMLGPVNGQNIAFDNNEIMARNNGDTSALYIQNDAGDLMLVGQEGGQVGIGITNPSFLPSPEYLLAVDGKIICEEAHVELSEGWPDYVFTDEYELRSLQQLENEILSLGHLPGIPSAQVVETNGLELGEMQRLMMEKIEELTLYMINADKQIRELERNNEVLMSQIQKLQGDVENK